MKKLIIASAIATLIPFTPAAQANTSDFGKQISSADSQSIDEVYERNAEEQARLNSRFESLENKIVE